MCSASNSCRCASTPSLTSPGSTPSSWLESCSIDAMVMRSSSPALLVTTQYASASVPSGTSASVSRHGAHPVERLVRAIVGVHAHRTIGFDQQQPPGHRQMAVSRPT